MRLRYAADQLGVEVIDVGDAAPDGERALLGIHERVALYGGELVAEPVAGSGTRSARGFRWSDRVNVHRFSRGRSTSRSPSPCCR